MDEVRVVVTVEVVELEIAGTADAQSVAFTVPAEALGEASEVVQRVAWIALRTVLEARRGR